MISPLDTAGIRTADDSALFKDLVPAEDAEVARQRRGDAGKLNLCTAPAGCSACPPTHDPRSLAHVTGGSSYRGGRSSRTGRQRRSGRR